MTALSSISLTEYRFERTAHVEPRSLNPPRISSPETSIGFVQDLYVRSVAL
ncbi:hypothetical protein ADILRU_0338 [Leifsonia rubra CMS 76R]|nr:hypothetical protein ADILRU_0338 [Leifsonia rubra CMS 76R]